MQFVDMRKILISGPRGVGKSTLFNLLTNRPPPAGYLPTRSVRVSSHDGLTVIDASVEYLDSVDSVIILHPSDATLTLEDLKPFIGSGRPERVLVVVGDPTGIQKISKIDKIIGINKLEELDTKSLFT